MTGLVLDLQGDALNKDIAISDLLRKALVVSRKLDVEDVRQWIQFELDGYDLNDRHLEESLAPYRMVRGVLKFKNPYHGWQPAIVEDEELSKLISERFVAQSIAEVQDLVRDSDSAPMAHFDGFMVNKLMQMFNCQLEPGLMIPRQSIIKIIDSVRNKVLDWALQLEKQGILGEGLSFTREEKVAANQITYSTVNHIGTMNQSQLQQNSSGQQSIIEGPSVEKIGGLLVALEGALQLFKLAREQEAELQAEIATLKTQLASPKPKAGVIRECLTSVKVILEGAAGNMLASGLAAQIPPLLAGMS